MDCSIPGPPVHHQLPEFTKTHVHWVRDAIQPSHPLSSLSPPTFNLFQHQVFSNESILHIRWPKYCRFSFNISPSNEYSGLTDFLQNGLVGSPFCPRDSQEPSPTKKFKSINSSVLSFLYSPTLTSTYEYWKNHSFDCTDLCFGKVMSLLFNMLSRFVIVLPRSKHLLISWLQSQSAVILEPKK